MQLVKLDAIDSTNAYLKRSLQNEVIEDYTVVVANEQLLGRGQSGTNWVSEAGKNLTFSVFKKFDTLQAADHFCLNMIVSLSIYRSLKRFKVPDLHIKWPNDILSGDLKMCGILIETLMAGNKVKSAVVGIGLNVNQTSFPKTINATSLKSIFKKSYDLNNLLELLVADLKKAFLGNENFDWHSIQQAYEDQLYKKGQLSSFVDANGQKSKGIIRGISKTGKLVIEFDMKPQEFDLKEIKMVLD